MSIQLFKPVIYDDTIQLVGDVLRSGWIGLGPRVKEFELEFAKYVGAKHAIALNSGTEALRCAVELMETEWGPFVISTPNTFISTNHVLKQAGCKIMFADIDPDTGMITPDSIKKCLDHYQYKQRIGAIMVVHYGGMPCELDEIYSLAKTYGLNVIEDAAHAFGAEYKGRKIGSKATFGCFSLHAVKPLCVGDGGMLTTDSDRVAERARQWRWLGINKSTIDRSDHTKYSWNYDVEMLGHKSHMNDITAAIGLGQLKHYDEDKKKRQDLVDMYYYELQGDVGLMRRPIDRKSANHLMVIRLESRTMRDKVRNVLEDEKIQTGLHYKPNFLYRQYPMEFRENWGKGMNEFYNTALTLPLHLELTASDVYDICMIIKEVIHGERKW